MLQIEQENSNDIFCAFDSSFGYPPAGATLTVYDTLNVNKLLGHMSDYKDLTAGDLPDPTPDAGHISGRLTWDADCNNNEFNDETGAWDTGIEGQTIELLDAHGNVVATTTTGSDGSYRSTWLRATTV